MWKGKRQIFRVPEYLKDLEIPPNMQDDWLVAMFVEGEEKARIGYGKYYKIQGRVTLVPTDEVSIPRDKKIYRLRAWANVRGHSECKTLKPSPFLARASWMDLAAISRGRA